MKRIFELGTYRQALAATIVILWAAATTVAQENQQANPDERPAENREEVQEGVEPEDNEQSDAVVLKMIELKSMSVENFLSAARLAGVVDQHAAAYGNRQPRPNLQQGADAQQRLFVATKPDSSTLFLRGPEKKVEKVEELAKKLDVPANEMPETLKFENGKQARLIPEAEMNATMELLRSLGFTSTRSSFGDAHFLVFDASDEKSAKQIEEVIDKLSEGRDKKEKEKKAAKGEAKQESEEQQSQGQEEAGEGDVEKAAEDAAEAPAETAAPEEQDSAEVSETEE